MKNKVFLYLFVIFLFCNNEGYSIEYKDIPSGFWAYRAIDKLTDEGIISGVSKDEFMPSKLVTRAEYATMVVKAINQDEMAIERLYTFEDIDVNHWAYNSVQRALNLDILKPADDGFFYPNDYITRSEVITFLVNILKTEHISKKEAIIALQNKYIDFEEVPDWFKVTAGKAEIINVITNEPERRNLLDYDAYVTRAQMAMFLANLKREIESYAQEKRAIETSPKVVSEGIVIDGVKRADDVVTIPARTALPIMIIGQISTKKSKAGDMFQARFVNNLVDYDYHLLLSKDLVLVGKILDVEDGRAFIRNGEILFEFSAVNNNNLYTRIQGAVELSAKGGETNKFSKVTRAVFKAKELTLNDGQIIYIRLFKPLRVNIVTQEILD